MSGYIEYDDSSIYSPAYPRPITIDNISYTSAYEAIQAGKDPLNTILVLVRNNRDVYYPYRHYIFQGTYSDLLNEAITTLYIPRREPIDIGKYLYILDKDIVGDLDVRYSVPIIRNVYITQDEGNNIHRQVQALDTVELYNVFLVGDIPLYIGSTGAFFLLEEKDQDVSLAISRLQI